MTILRRCAPLVVLSVASVLLSPLCFARNSAAGSRQSSLEAGEAHFDFHSSFWINLHHFLYEEAAVQDDGPRPTRHEPLSPEDAAISSILTPDEQKTWSSAISYYKKNLVSRDLLSNDAMRNIKNRLEDSGQAATLTRSRLDPALIAVLDRAAPVYRAHWWRLHDAANRKWIDCVKPLFLLHGKELSEDLAKAFGAPWPGQPLRVDVVAYANWAGAYTSLRPSRITISSLDDRNQQTAALEILFHEGSHTLVEAVGDALIRDFATHRKTAPRDLWHALLFFTAGFYVHQLYPDYVPYAERNNLWQHGFSSQFRTALIEDWQPRLEGKVTLDAALASLAADLTAHRSS